jgi:hypothetical protein
MGKEVADDPLEIREWNPAGASPAQSTPSCSDAQTSGRLRTNIASTQRTFGENIAPVVLTVAENVLTFG